MKSLTIAAAIIGAFLYAFDSSAQVATNSTTADSVIYDETMWTMKKRKMVMDHMDLTEAEKSSFWPIYESYSMAIQYMESETLHIISVCNDPGSGIDQAELEQYSKKMLQNDLLLDRVRIQYYRKFSRALSPARATQFMQLDDNLRMMLRMDVQNAAQTSGVAQASMRW
jgi:Spy/CpxP family protein refolding chaperone